MPHACGAPYVAEGKRAKDTRLQGGCNILVGEQQSLFIFALVLAKINVLCFGIAKMLLKKARCVRKFSFFIFCLPFSKNKWAKLEIAKLGLKNLQKCVGKKKQKTSSVIVEVLKCR